jgi:hypothetical protein
MYLLLSLSPMELVEPNFGSMVIVDKIQEE